MENFERLMLAAEVRKIATELRQFEMESAEIDAAKARMPFLAFAWKAQHPVEEFIPRALAALIDTDMIISAQPGQATL